jgi:hypothetical protein
VFLIGWIEIFRSISIRSPTSLILHFSAQYRSIKGRHYPTSKFVSRCFPGGDDIFLTRPDRPRGPTMSIGSFPRVKRPGRGVDHTIPPSAEVKETMEVHIYSTCGSSWSVLGQNVPLHLAVTFPAFLQRTTKTFRTSSKFCVIYVEDARSYS